MPAITLRMVADAPHQAAGGIAAFERRTIGGAAILDVDHRRGGCNDLWAIVQDADRCVTPQKPGDAPLGRRFESIICGNVGSPTTLQRQVVTPVGTFMVPADLSIRHTAIMQRSLASGETGP
jgi:hypothetical protein